MNTTDLEMRRTIAHLETKVSNLKKTLLDAQRMPELRQSNYLGKVSLQCAALQRELKPKLDHYILYPLNMEQNINTPELFRTMKISEITQINTEIEKRMEGELTEFSQEQKIELYEKGILAYENMIKVVKQKVKNQARETLAGESRPKKENRIHADPNFGKQFIHLMLGVNPVVTPKIDPVTIEDTNMVIIDNSPTPESQVATSTVVPMPMPIPIPIQNTRPPMIPQPQVQTAQIPNPYNSNNFSFGLNPNQSKNTKTHARKPTLFNDH